jgi:hypothetical protein
MEFEYGPPLVRDQDWPSPSVRELDILQDRMQSAYTTFKPGDQLSRLPNRDVNVKQFAPILQVHKPTSENDSAVGQEATPEIGEVNRVEGLPRS